MITATCYSAGSSPNAPISPPTPATSSATSETPPGKTMTERLNDISGVIKVQEKSFAELHVRLAHLTTRVAKLRGTLNHESNRSPVKIPPISSRKADVLYPPEFGIPVVEGRCRRLCQQLGLPKLEIPGSGSLSSRGRSKEPRAL